MLNLTLIAYQKLLYETAFLSQQPPKYIWSQINKLMSQAYHYQVAYMDLSAQLVTRQAKNIQQLYQQLCMHSLLNVRAMRRSSILLIQRLLPIWAEYIDISIGPKTNTRVFVDINSNSPPNYLTANSAINPFDEQYACLFIDLEPLVAYLEQRTLHLSDSNNDAIEYRLMTNVLLTINYRYIERKTTMLSKYSPKQPATIVTAFNNIHYQMANQCNLREVIGTQDLVIVRVNNQQQSVRLQRCLLSTEAFSQYEFIILSFGQ